MTSVGAKIRCAALIGAGAIAINGCRFRYEQLELLASGGTGVPTNGGDGTPGRGSFGGDTGAGDGGAGNTDDVGDGGAVTAGGMNGTSGGTDGSGTGSGGTISGGTDSGGTAGGGGPGVCVPDASCACEVFQGHDYRFCAVEVWRDVGLAACQAANMGLIRVDSAEENAWLLQQFADHGMFIGTRGPLVFLGGSDLAVEGQWRWADGTLFWDGGPVGNLYNNFANAPRVGQGDCVVMFDDGSWGDRACNSGDATVGCESP